VEDGDSESKIFTKSKKIRTYNIECDKCQNCTENDMNNRGNTSSGSDKGKGKVVPVLN
jgi:hypothetical protein